MWVLGNARTALTGRRALGKREETEEWLSLENKQTFVSERREREREKTVWLPVCLLRLTMEKETVSETAQTHPKTS